MSCSKIGTFCKQHVNREILKIAVITVIAVALIMIALLAKDSALGGVRKNFFVRGGLLAASIPFFIVAAYLFCKPEKKVD